MAKKKQKAKGASPRKERKAQTGLTSQRLDHILRKGWVCSAFLGILFLIALLIRLSYLKYYQSPLTGDAVIYAKIAWGIKNGYGLHWWSVVWSPFYPFMTLLFSVVMGNLEAATTAVSLVLGSLVVVPFFFLAKDMLNYKAAYLGSILVVFFPALVVISEVPLSEATYAFFLLITLLCGWRLILRRSYLYALLFGLLGGICYLTRPEFLVAFALLLLAFLIIDLKGKANKKPRTLVLLVISLVGFLVLALPYVKFMHSKTGHWILSGKTAHNVLKEKAYAEGLDYSGQRKALAQVLDGLTPEGQPKGKVLLGKESMFSFLKTPGFFASYFGRIWQGSKKTNLFLLPFLICLLFYLFTWKMEKAGWGRRLFLLFSFAPLLTMPIFFVPAGRLIEPYAPLVILMSAGGMLNLDRLATDPKGSKTAQERSTVGFWAALLVVVLLCVFSVAKTSRMAKDHQKVFQATKRGSTEFKRLGLWADRTLPEEASVMYLSWDTFFFYCNRETFTVPFAPWDEIVTFAQANGISHLLMSVSIQASWRDDLAFLLEPLKDRSKVSGDFNLELVDIYNAPSRVGAVLYEFVF